MPNDLVAIALEFDLPFALLVEDSFGPRRPDDYEDFQFVARGIPLTLRFTRKVRTDHSAVIDTHRPQDAASYTRAQVWFDGPAFQATTGAGDYRSRARDLIDLALASLNRYVMFYREATGSFWLRALATADVPEFAFVAFYQDGGRDSYFYEEASRDTSQPLSPEAEQALRDRFVSGAEPDPLQALAFTVRDLFERGEYWQATFTAGLLFDAKLAQLLRRAFERQGQAPDAITALFVGESGQPLSAGVLLRRYVVPSAGAGLSEGEHPLATGVAHWEASVAGHRAALLRGEAPAIGVREAEEAIVTVTALLAQVEAVLSGTEPGRG